MRSFIVCWDCGDTGRFLYPSTSAHTLAVAAQLRTFNFNAADLNRELDQMPLKVAKLAGYIYQNLEIDANGAARVVLPQSILNSYDIVDSETATIVSMPEKLKMFSHGQSLLNSRKVIIAFGYVPKDQSLIQLLKTSWRRPSFGKWR